MIKVEQIDPGEPMGFDVLVEEGCGSTRHQVTMHKKTYETLTASKVSPPECVEAAFRFLLDHESKESILRRFDITVISTYFPNFQRDLPRYFSSPG
jgi:hypothetical protein